MKLLWKKTNQADRELFPFDIRIVLWMQYFKSYILGIRQYLLKDPLNTVPAAVKRQQRLENMIYSVIDKILVNCIALAELECTG